MLAQTKQHVPCVFCKFQSTFMGLSQFNCSSTKWEDGEFAHLCCKVGDQRWKTACISSFSCFCDQASRQGQLKGERIQFGFTAQGHSPSCWEVMANQIWIAGYIRVMVKKQNKMNAMLSRSLYVIQPRIPHSGNRPVHCHLMSSRSSPTGLPGQRSVF